MTLLFPNILLKKRGNPLIGGKLSSLRGYRECDQQRVSDDVKEFEIFFMLYSIYKTGEGVMNIIKKAK